MPQTVRRQACNTTRCSEFDLCFCCYGCNFYLSLWLKAICLKYHIPDTLGRHAFLLTQCRGGGHVHLCRPGLYSCAYGCMWGAYHGISSTKPCTQEKRYQVVPMTPPLSRTGGLVSDMFQLSPTFRRKLLFPEARVPLYCPIVWKKYHGGREN